MIRISLHVGDAAELTNGIEGHQVHVGMRHVHSYNLLAYINRAEHLFKAVGDLFSGFHNRPVGFIVQIPDKFNLLLRDYQSVTRLHGMNIQESQRLLILVNFVAGDFALNNLRKNRVLHTLIVASLKTLMLACRSVNSDTTVMTFNNFAGREYAYKPLVEQIVVDHGDLESRYLVLPEAVRRGGRDPAQSLSAISYDLGQEVLGLIATECVVDAYGKDERRNYTVTSRPIGFVSYWYSLDPKCHTFMRFNKSCHEIPTKRAIDVSKFMIANADGLEPSVAQKVLKAFEPIAKRL